MTSSQLLEWRHETATEWTMMKSTSLQMKLHGRSGKRRLRVASPHLEYQLYKYAPHVSEHHNFLSHRATICRTKKMG